MNIIQALKMTCQEATALHGKKETGQLTMAENFGLRLHLIICKLCRLFFAQINTLEEAASKFSNSSFTLASDKKAKLQNAFDAELRK